ncbi:MAG: hypothetical protein HY700_00500 [Gemmatimonadetes bacterium]|nr:hypothetical protein [Gemmatimonadota bacterium]
MCPYGEDDGRCVPLIAPNAPVVVLIHERVVARDRPFGLLARDPTDTTRAPDPTYQFVFDCGTTNDPPAPPPAGLHFRPESGFQCRAPAEWWPQPKSGDSAGVQVRVRDRTGAIGMYQGFVQVRDGAGGG